MHFRHTATTVMKAHPLALLCFMAMPRWFNDLVGVDMQLNPKPFNFFTQLAREVIQQRKANRTRHRDLLQFLIDSTVDESDIEKLNYGQMTADTETDCKCSFSKILIFYYLDILAGPQTCCTC